MLKSTLRLFNSILIEHPTADMPSANHIAHMVKMGYVVHHDILITDEILSEIDSAFGLSATQANASFHKNWSVVRDSSEKELIVQQILHYFTTYGIESIFGTYDGNFVYIPSENLALPDGAGIPFVFINAITEEELKVRVTNLIASGIALSKESIEDLKVVIQEQKYGVDVLGGVKNNELKSWIYDFCGIVPSDPLEFLRYAIQKLTGETLLIKNHKMISALKSVDPDRVDAMFEQAPRNMASIFYRYKPLFLALKSAAGNKTYFNRLRKEAEYYHKSLDVDYLNSITDQIKNGVLNVADLEVAIEKYPVWRLIRLAYALHVRMLDIDTLVYRIRNGKIWYKQNSVKFDVEQIYSAFEIVMYEIANRVSKKVDGVKVYIPDYIRYALPQSEKQFCGNMPYGTRITIGNNPIVGVHWYNKDDTFDGRIDLDFSAISLAGEKYGWDARWRSEDSTILFSGDMTDAPLKKDGASELYYFDTKNPDMYLLQLNHYNCYENVSDHPYKLFLANEIERPSGFTKDYVVNPNDVIYRVSNIMDSKEVVVGIIKIDDERAYFYFLGTAMGGNATSRPGKKSDAVTKFYSTVYTSPLTLDDILMLAGAHIVNEVPEDEEYIDLSPETISKDTLIELLSDAKHE